MLERLVRPNSLIFSAEQQARQGAGQEPGRQHLDHGSGLQSDTQYFSHPSPIGNGINIHLKTSAGFPLPTGKSPNSVTQREKSFAICPLLLSSSIFSVPAIPSSAMLGGRQGRRGMADPRGNRSSPLVSLDLGQAMRSLAAASEKLGYYPLLFAGC